MEAGTARDMYGFFSLFVLQRRRRKEGKGGEGVVTDACVRGKKGGREKGKEGDVCGCLSLLSFYSLSFYRRGE